VTLSQSRPRSDQPIAQLRLLRPTDVAFSARSVRPLTTLDKNRVQEVYSINHVFT